MWDYNKELNGYNFTINDIILISLIRDKESNVYDYKDIFGSNGCYAINDNYTINDIKRYAIFYFIDNLNSITERMRLNNVK